MNIVDLDNIPINNFFHFFIYTDYGVCLYKLSNEKEFDASMQGILQALYFTSQDLNYQIKLVTTEFGLLAYKLFTYPGDKSKSLLLSLILPNYFGDEQLAEKIVEKTLGYIYNIFVMHIGLNDLYAYGSVKETDILKKLIKIYEPSIKYILNNYGDLNFLLESERKLEVSNDVLYPIKHCLKIFSNLSKIKLICLTMNSSIVWSSSDWQMLDIVDRLLFLVISKVYCNQDISEIPIYFSKTELESENSGKTSYKLFNVDLLSTNNMRIILITDNAMSIKTIYDSFNSNTFDDFFLSRLISFKNEVQLGNIIDSTVKSLVVLNTQSNSYKIMVEETSEQIFSNFIQNVHFCSALITRKFNDSYNNEEFYVKGDIYTFYYFRISNLIFLILFDKDTRFDDINTVKVTIKTFKERFECKEIN